MIASDHVDFVGAESTGGPYTGGNDQNAEEIALEEANHLAYEAAKALYMEKYPESFKGKKPKFRPPPAKTLSKPKSEKICIRLFIRGLEQSDVERCSPPDRKVKAPQRKRWIEEVHEPTLDRFAMKWAAQLSHQARRERFKIPSQVLRRTTALQDVRSKKERQLKGLELRAFGYGGKGKGRGKTILPPKPGSLSRASKNKGSTGASHSAANKKIRQT